MKPTAVIAIFDVGKTNKKLFLFDEQYKIVYEKTARFNETIDEDGDPCENIESLKLSIFESLNELTRLKEFEIKAVNFSTYGASFVYIDDKGLPLTPLYNYLKPYPEELQKSFYECYGGEAKFCYQTASPALGSLNSGLQLYRVKKQQPLLFNKIKYALHLPQYLSYLLTGQAFTDVTSIGCHTALWDFERNDYHDWVIKEGLTEKFAPIHPAASTVPVSYSGVSFQTGIGLHDSSAALIPYLVNFAGPFVLLSTGTWSISLNPFNLSSLTGDELKNDCIKYLRYNGKPVKASRLFSGHGYDQQVKRIAAHFNQDSIKYKTIVYDPETVSAMNRSGRFGVPAENAELKTLPFSQRALSCFSNDTEAYYQLMIDIVNQQKASTNLVLKGSNAKRFFVDGGFSKNSVFMHLLAAFFPGVEVFAASMAQATAVGAALAIHQAWNTKALPTDIIELKYYSNIQSSLI